MAEAGVLEFQRLGVVPEHVAQYGLQTHDHKIPKGSKTVPDSWIERATTDGFDPTQAIELDAYLTADIQAIVRDAVTPLIDADMLAETIAAEEQDCETLRKLSDEYDSDDDNGDWMRLHTAQEQRAETLKDSEALRTKLINRLKIVRGQFPAVGDDCDTLRAEVESVPTVSNDHARAVLRLQRESAEAALRDMEGR